MFRPPHSLSSVPTCVHSDRFPPVTRAAFHSKGFCPSHRSVPPRTPGAEGWVQGRGRHSTDRPEPSGRAVGEETVSHPNWPLVEQAQPKVGPSRAAKDAPLRRWGWPEAGATVTERCPLAGHHGASAGPGPSPQGPSPLPGPVGRHRARRAGGGAGIVPEWSRPVHTQERNTASGETVQGTERHTACTCVLECRDRDREDAGETDTGKFAWHVVVRPTSP